MTSGAPRLRTPTTVGQTNLLVRVDGALTAHVMWDELPYWVRARWADAEVAVSESALAAYLGTVASPVVLRAAADHPRLSEAVRQVARERLSDDRYPPALLERLGGHFQRMLDQSHKRLLVRLSTHSGNELDRVDLLGEVVALRDMQADLSSERQLARAFRALFVTHRPWAVYAMIALLVLAFVIVSALGKDDGRGVTRAAALYPNLDRPWTLLSYPWFHLGVGHLALNVLALGLVGNVLEKVLGHVRVVVAFVACAIGAGVVSIAFKLITDIPFWTVGASGAIAGLAGLAVYLGLWFQSRYGRIPIRYAGATLAGAIVLASNMLLMASGGDLASDHGAHIGGLVVGVTTGFLLRHRLAARADRAFGKQRRRA